MSLSVQVRDALRPRRSKVERGWRALASNTSVLTGTMVASNLVRFGSNLVLTRLLAPEAFGVMLLIASVGYILTMMTETGTAAFVIRAEKGDQPRYLDTLWTIAFIRLVGVAGIIVMLAPAITSAMGKPDLAPALQVSSLTFVASAFKSFAPYVTTRRQNQRYNAIVTFGTSLVSTVSTIGLAWWTGTYWGLVYGLLLGSVLQTIATYVFYRDATRKFAFDKEVALELWRFSGFLLASSLLTVIVVQFDKLFVLTSLPLAIAGIYALAINLAQVPIQISTAYFSTVYMPDVSDKLRRGPVDPSVFYHPMRIVRPLLLFACAGGTTFGTTFFDLFFPPEYAQAGVFFSFLSVYPIFTTYANAGRFFLIANKMTKKTFVADCFRAGWLVPAALIGWSQFGIWGLIGAVALTDLAPAAYQYFVLGRLGALRLRDELPSLAAVVAGACLGFVASEAAVLAGL